MITDVSIFFWGVTIHYAMWFRKNEPFHLTTFFSTRLHGLWLAPHRQSAGGAKLTRGSCRLVEIDVWLRGYGPGTNGIYRHNMILYNGGIKWWNNCIKLYYRNNIHDIYDHVIRHIMVYHGDIMFSGISSTFRRIIKNIMTYHLVTSLEKKRSVGLRESSQ